MKMSLQVKLGIFIVLLFAAVITTCLLYTPVRLRWNTAKLNSENIFERVDAIDALLEIGEEGRKAIIDNYGEGEKAAKLIINCWYDVNGIIDTGLLGLTAGVEDRPIILAAKWKLKETVELLMESGANIDVKDDSGMTALYWMVVFGDKDMVLFLLTKGARIDALVNRWGDTPLHNFPPKDIPSEKHPEREIEYEEKRRKECMAILIENGLDVNTKDTLERTPLHIAARRGRPKLCDFFISKGADLNMEDSQILTPLHLAAGEGWIDVLVLLVDKGANIEAADLMRMTPLHLAIEKGKELAAVKLIELGADVNAKKLNGARPLHVASMYGTKISVIRLIEKGADIKAKTMSGFTCLHIAAYGGRLSLCKFFVEKGLDIEAEVEGLWRPLHYAAFEGKKECAAFLLEKGADVNAVSESGITPLDYALRNKHSDTADLIRSHGGKTGEELKKESEKK
ncbi:MAG: ankyrin repeat domain-containing protein [Planctomycetota bacterium]